MNEEETKVYEYEDIDLIHFYYDRKTNECKELVRKEKYDKVQNNWNELKYYFKKQTIELEKVREDISMDTYINRKMFLKEVLDKIQELEQGKDE